MDLKAASHYMKQTNLVGGGGAPQAGWHFSVQEIFQKGSDLIEGTNHVSPGL